MNPYFAPSQAELLAHASFLESLSRRLVTDRNTADDVVQDTWLTVLERPPRHSINVAGWMRSVAGNLVRHDRRARSRRAEHESLGARGEEVPDVADEVARDQLLRRVASAVDALPEPYRTVVYLRFFEDLPPREIAERTETPVATVKSQLHRGLERLRAELAGEFGDEGVDWRAALCGAFGWSLRPDGTLVEAAPPALGLGARVAAALVVVAALGTLAVLELGRGDETPATALAEAPVATAAAPVATATGERTAVAPTSPGAASAATPWIVAVVDPDGKPVPGAAVHAARATGLEVVAETDARGLARLALDAEDRVPPRVLSEMQSPIPELEPRVGLMATAPGHSPSLLSWIAERPDGDAPLTITLGPPGPRLAGRVVDEHGTPVADALLERHDAREGVLRSSASDLAVHATPRARTDGLGRFAFDSLPAGLYWLRIEADGHALRWERRVAHAEDEDELVVTLETAAVVTGRVRGPDGAPVEGARVWTRTPDEVHEIAALTDRDGAFRLEGVHPGDDRFCFVQGGPQGRLAARGLFSLAAGEERGWYPVLQELPGVRVRVVDEDGAPRAELPLHLRVRSPSRIARVDVTTDASGEFTLYEHSLDLTRIDFAVDAHYGTLFTFPDAHLLDVRPGPEAHTVELPRDAAETCALEFELTRADGSAFDEFVLLARSEEDGVLRRVFVGRETASVRARDVVPGDLELVAAVTGLGHLDLGRVHAAPGEVARLDDVRAPATGTLRLAWRYAPGGDEGVGLVQHLPDLDVKPLAVRLRLADDGAPPETVALLPGEYTLRVTRGRRRIDTVSFTIDSGFETLIEVGPEDETRD